MQSLPLPCPYQTLGSLSLKTRLPHSLPRGRNRKLKLEGEPGDLGSGSLWSSGGSDAWTGIWELQSNMAHKPPVGQQGISTCMRNLLFMLFAHTSRIAGTNIHKALQCLENVVLAFWLNKIPSILLQLGAIETWAGLMFSMMWVFTTWGELKPNCKSPLGDPCI